MLDLEIDLLSSLQNRIFGGKGPEKENMIPIWICLWLLVLTYRETIDALGSGEQEKGPLPQQCMTYVYSRSLAPFPMSQES